jgi:hypothetical protein
MIGSQSSCEKSAIGLPEGSRIATLALPAADVLMLSSSRVPLNLRSGVVIDPPSYEASAE